MSLFPSSYNRYILMFRYHLSLKPKISKTQLEKKSDEKSWRILGLSQQKNEQGNDSTSLRNRSSAFSCQTFRPITVQNSQFYTGDLIANVLVRTKFFKIRKPWKCKPIKLCLVLCLVYFCSFNYLSFQHLSPSDLNLYIHNCWYKHPLDATIFTKFV